MKAGKLTKELLAAACNKKCEAIDETFCFEVFALDPNPTQKP